LTDNVAARLSAVEEVLTIGLLITAPKDARRGEEQAEKVTTRSEEVKRFCG
jgi:hypothetical protein